MKIITVLLLSIFLLVSGLALAEDSGEYQYQTPEQITSKLKELANQNKSIASFTSLGQSPGQRDISLLTLGNSEKGKPAILVVANMEGDYPIASEAALSLANHLTTDWKDELEKQSWLIVACGNPDGYARFFNSPLHLSFVNDRKQNDDKDDATNEDGPNDLNKDGFITTMRQEHPEGTWVEVTDNPLLLREVDNAKGEVGKYRLFTEGIDNDSDGEINEDAPGGVNPGHNFPHDFNHFTKTDGLHSASESETRAILEFAFDHTEIAMLISLGRRNSLIEVPSSNNRSQVADTKYKVPERWGKQMGLEKDKKYEIGYLLELVKDWTGYDELTEEELIQWLGAGAAVNPDKSDTKYWEEISEKYNDFLKDAELDGKRLDAPKFSSGSIEEWSYFQFGIPTFAMDFWTLPEPEKEEKETDSTMISLDSLENLTSEQFIEMGEETITKFLKDNDAPKMYTAEMIIKGLKGGMMTPKRMAKFMRKSAKKDDEGGADEADEALFAVKPGAYLEWTPYDHPTLGKIEIGGKIPYADVTPPADQVTDLIEKQLPFVRELAAFLPKIRVDKITIKKQNSDIWRVDAWIKNIGFLPYPTHQGKRCQRPSPVVIKLLSKKMTILEGKERIPIGLLSGTNGFEKLTWLIQAPAGSKITVDAQSFSAGTDTKTVTLVDGGTN